MLERFEEWWHILRWVNTEYIAASTFFSLPLFYLYFFKCWSNAVSSAFLTEYEHRLKSHLRLWEALTYMNNINQITKYVPLLLNTSSFADHTTSANSIFPGESILQHPSPWESVFNKLCFHHFSLEGRPKHREKYAFSNLSRSVVPNLFQLAIQVVKVLVLHLLSAACQAEEKKVANGDHVWHEAYSNKIMWTSLIFVIAARSPLPHMWKLVTTVISV